MRLKTSVLHVYEHVAASRSSSARAFSLYRSRSAPAQQSVERQIKPRPTTSQREILTLLHKTNHLLPRVLPSPGLWTSLLQSVYEDLDSQSTSPVHVVVYGVDEWSGAQDLVTALLEEPFNSDGDQADHIRNRWKEVEERSLTLHEGHSSYLRQHALPVQLTEIKPPPGLGNTVKIQSGDIASLFAADIPIVVFNPLTTPLPTLLRNTNLPWHNTRAMIVITASGILPPLDHCLLSSQPAHGIQASKLKDNLCELKILSIDPKRAIGALNILKANPMSATAVQRYQDDFLGSGISMLSHKLSESLNTLDDTNPFADNLRHRAVSRIRGALMACKSHLLQSKQDLDLVRSGVSELRRDIANIQEGVVHNIFDVPNAANSLTSKELPADEVDRALKDSERAMKAVLDRLTWWRMIAQVDEIGTIIGDSVSRTWCRELDAKLLIHTGHLIFIQEKLTSSTLHLLSQLPLSSPVLQNTLLQISSAPSYSLSSQTLIEPLHHRRSQIIQYPTARLHLAAQRVALGVISSVAVGASVSWAGWVGWLAEGGLLGLVGMDTTTSLGVGVLSTLAGVRWAVGRWEHAKKRWWEDWYRVGDGLSRDLKVNLNRVVSNNIVIVPETASAKLLELVERKKNVIADLEDELDSLEMDLEVIEEPSRKK